MVSAILRAGLLKHNFRSLLLLQHQSKAISDILPEISRSRKLSTSKLVFPIPAKFQHCDSSVTDSRIDRPTVMKSLNNFPKTHFHTGCFRHCVTSEDADRNNININDYRHNDGSKRDTATLLETWFYEVSPYGSLNANLPFKTVIKPLNPQNYPDMNKCIIEFHYNIDESSDSQLPTSHQLSQISDLYNLNVTFDKEKANMNLNCDVIEGVNIPVSCYLRVPLKFDLTIYMKGNEAVSVENMESDSICIETDSGDVLLSKIKSGSVSAISRSGDIVSRSTTLGNVCLQCGGAGSISADKLQGSSVTCTTEMGSIHVKSLYAEGSTFKTLVGDVHLGQCHGQVCIAGEKSNLVIGSLDGDMDVGIHQGSVNVHLSRHNKVDVDLNSGDIGLSFPEEARTDLVLSSPTITVAKNLSVHFDNAESYQSEGHIGDRGVAQVHARTLSGNIGLKALDWIQTTKLAFSFGDKEEGS